MFVNPNSYLYLLNLNNKICLDSKICLLACREVNNIPLIDASLLNNFRFVLMVVKNYPLNIQHIIKVANITNKDNLFELYLQAIEKNHYVYNLLPEFLLKSTKFIQQAIELNPDVIIYLKSQNALYSNFNLTIKKFSNKMCYFKNLSQKLTL